jgi:hypothetical protein
MDINVQTAVDKLIASSEQNSPQPEDVATLLAWAELDGWDDCIKAWEAVGEPVVVDWSEFCDEFANDHSIEEYEDIDPNGLTDDDRLAHLLARLSYSHQDPDDGRSWSVHPLRIANTLGINQIALVLCQGSGQAGYCLNLLGVYEDIDQSLRALKMAGYRRVDYALTTHELVSLWSKLTDRRNPYIQ